MSATPDLATAILRWFTKFLLVRHIARFFLWLLGLCSRRKPALRVRVTNFGLIGLTSFLTQLGMFKFLQHQGMSVSDSIIIAVVIGATVNYIPNRLVTWRDRLVYSALIQELVLFGLFFILKPTTYFKIFGVSLLFYRWGLSTNGAIVITEVIGAFMSYLGADKITFGWAINFTKRVF